VTYLKALKLGPEKARRPASWGENTMQAKRSVILSLYGPHALKRMDRVQREVNNLASRRGGID